MDTACIACERAVVSPKHERICPQSEWRRLDLATKEVQRSSRHGNSFFLPEKRDITAGMKRRICICCGKPMFEGGNELSRNPNICASCSSMAEGMDEPKVSRVQTHASASPEAAELKALVTNTAPDASEKSAATRQRPRRSTRRY